MHGSMNVANAHFQNTQNLVLQSPIQSVIILSLMGDKKVSLFSINLRIDSKITKLQVYEDDNLTDLVDRLLPTIASKYNSQAKVKAKLQSQFRKIVNSEGLSEKVREKLECLVEQSKFVIVGIEVQKNDVELNETPFKILQESALNGRKIDVQNNRKSFHYLGDASLNLKYQSEGMRADENRRLSEGDTRFDNVVLRTKNDTLEQYSENDGGFRRTEKVGRSPHFTRNYQKQPEVQRQRPITQFQHNISYQPHNRYEQTHHNGGHQRSLKLSDERAREFKYRHEQPLRPICNNRLNQERNLNQTYQQYRFNYTNNLGKEEPAKEQSYRTLSNREIHPSKSYTKLNYFGQSNGATICNYDAGRGETKRNYDSAIGTKTLNGVVSSKGLKGKFNYFAV